MDHGDHSMGDTMNDVGKGPACKISMLWNWNTIDTCFLSSTWHVRSSAMFAGSCIGVVLLVMSLEFLRRSVKEYDRFLLRKYTDRQAALSGTPPANCAMPGYRPTILEQGIRALLHMIQFAVAYFVMLLAMYYNGYIIICIFIGAYLGAFIFQWETLGINGSQTSAVKEVTVCCG
ncbi:Ctr copper transporter family-domain-containing protein [Rhypophila decipiens]|uniref:Copper transport protein n=1 Tax=Rhypophila decipiens TaxID=261697 RepID=A0AAN7BAW5_9PEZI|nr:Ctr copper transporter family-domain-containing protein [Rhypophila decipiens]